MENSKNGGYLIERMLERLVNSDAENTFVDPFGEYENAFIKETVAFMDEIPGGFLIYRADGDEEIIYANKALLNIFRCKTLREFKNHTGNSFKGIVYPLDLDYVEKSIVEQIAVSKDAMDYVEYRIRRTDGEIRWVDDYGHFIRTKSAGDVFYVFISDITEEKKRRAEETAALVNEKERTFKNIIEEYDKERKLINQEHLRRLEVIEGLSANYESILYIDLDSDKVLPYRMSERIESYFSNGCNTLAYKKFVKNYVKSWVYDDDKKAVLNALEPQKIKRELAKSKTYYVNYRVLLNGKAVHMQLRVVNVGGEKHISQAVVGTRNIEEEMERDRRQTQALEKALAEAELAGKARDTFLSNMSHDMRTLLNAVLGYAALAKNGASGQTSEYLDKIEISGKQLLDLIEKVLVVSQTGSGRAALSNERCSLKEILTEVYDTAHFKAEKKNITVELNADNVLHSELVCDKDKLKQILTYISGNAVKYTQNGGKVQINVYETPSARDGFADFLFEIADNGVGIDESALKRIFQPFERERDTTSSGVFGAGLGLTIAKRFVDAMGGTITVSSKLGKGSVFTVKLCLETDRSSHEKADAEFAVCGQKILLVDDNIINLEIETEILEEQGFVIDTAADGREAVNKLQNSAQGEYSFVLMDIKMPVLDGLGAAKLIRSLPDRSKAEIPIIALSANAFESDKRLSLESGMNAHLAKPLDVQILLQTLARIFAN